MTEQFFLAYRTLLNSPILLHMLLQRLGVFSTEEKIGFYHKMTIQPAADGSGREEVIINSYQTYSRSTVPSQNTYVLPNFSVVDMSVMFRTQSEYWFTLDFRDKDKPSYDTAAIDTIFYIDHHHPVNTLVVPKSTLENQVRFDDFGDQPPRNSVPTC